MEWTELVLGFVFLVAIYRYLTATHKYWERLGIPGPQPLPFFGTYLCQFFVPFQVSETERFEKYGEIYGIYDGRTPGLIVGRPDLIKQIMVGTTALDVFTNRRAVKTTHPVMANFLSSLENEDWKRVRSITATTFSSGKLRSIIPIMMEASKAMLATISSHAENGSPIDLKALYGAYTMDVIAQSAFATIPNPHFVSNASQLFTFPFWRKFLDYVAPMWILEPLGFTVLPAKPMDFFKELTNKIIKRRRDLGDRRKDFLQLLIDAQAPDNGDGKGRKNLSEDEIIAQAVLFFSVGFETSSQLLTYASYSLALNPDCQDKLYEEIVKAEADADSGVEDEEKYLNLPYLNAVIDESLRLYNPVLRMERKATTDWVLGDTGITIKKGMIVGIPVWALHHSEKYYPASETFQPERFLPENRSKIHPFTYLPFGEGPRNCIGMRFALLECRLALAKILLNYKFVVSKETKQPLEFSPTGRPLLGPKAVMVGVEKRE